MPRVGTKPATQACALTGNRTSDLSACWMKPNQLSHISWATATSFYIFLFCEFIPNSSSKLPPWSSTCTMLVCKVWYFTNSSIGSLVLHRTLNGRHFTDEGSGALRKLADVSKNHIAECQGWWPNLCPVTPSPPASHCVFPKENVGKDLHWFIGVHPPGLGAKKTLTWSVFGKNSSPLPSPPTLDYGQHYSPTNWLLASPALSSPEQSQQVPVFSAFT